MFFIIKKPVNWLVSIWCGKLVVNRLTLSNDYHLHFVFYRKNEQFLLLHADRHQISLLILSELINFYSPWFSHDFRGNNSQLIHLNLVNIRTKNWWQFLNSMNMFLDPIYHFQRILYGIVAGVNKSHFDKKVFLKNAECLNNQNCQIWTRSSITSRTRFLVKYFIDRSYLKIE